MSVHSEVQNLFRNKSGNAPLSIRSRSGETEEGNSRFDLMASTAPSALEVLEEQDGRNARKKFLCAYFTLLKQWLNRFEFEYVKQLYVEGQDEKTTYDMLGLNPKRFKSNMQAKLAEHTDEVQELVDRSEWEDAELFSKCFLSSPTEILRDEKLATATPKTVKGFGNLIKARSRRENYLQAESDRYYQRKVYMRGFMAGKYAALHPRCTNKAERQTAYRRVRAIKERMRGVLALLRTFTYEFVFDSCAFDIMGLAPANAEKLPEFERFYRAAYNTLSDCLQSLYQIVVEGADVETIEQEEEARRKEWWKTEEQEEVKDNEEDTAKAQV